MCSDPINIMDANQQGSTNGSSNEQQGENRGNNSAMNGSSNEQQGENRDTACLCRTLCKCCGEPIDTSGSYVAMTQWLDCEDGTKVRRITEFHPHGTTTHIMEKTCPTGNCILCHEEQVHTQESIEQKFHLWKWACDNDCPCRSTQGWPS